MLTEGIYKKQPPFSTKIHQICFILIYTIQTTFTTIFFFLPLYTTFAFMSPNITTIPIFCCLSAQSVTSYMVSSVSFLTPKHSQHSLMHMHIQTQSFLHVLYILPNIFLHFHSYIPPLAHLVFQTPIQLHPTYFYLSSLTSLSVLPILLSIHTAFPKKGVSAAPNTSSLL